MTTSLDESSPAVQAHLSILQGVIQRMASNSASCKTWCVTLVAAVLVLLADNSTLDTVWVAAFPALILATLDAYYLGLEKGFRETYEQFGRKLHAGTLSPEDLYQVKAGGNPSVMQLKAFASVSVWGFYGPLVLLAFIVSRLVN